MEAIKHFILERIDRYKPKLEQSQKMFRKLPKNSVEQESWAGRTQELQGRIEELEIIYNKLSRL